MTTGHFRAFPDIQSFIIQSKGKIKKEKEYGS